MLSLQANGTAEGIGLATLPGLSFKKIPAVKLNTGLKKIPIAMVLRVSLKRFLMQMVTLYRVQKLKTV